MPLRRPHRVIYARRIVGVIFLLGAVTHAILLRIGIDYGPFAEASFIPFVRDAWESLVAPNSWLFIPLLILFEAATGALLLRYGKAAIAGLWLAIGFHLCLMLFGFGFWLWSVPMLIALAWMLRGTRAHIAFAKIVETHGNVVHFRRIA